MLKTVGNPSTRYGDQTIVDGNLVIATAGKGIDFSATPGTGTSELFNDYEEGTWTPTLTSASGVCTLTASSGTYTKVGRMVYFQGVITFTTDASVGTSNLTIGGLPFACSSAPGIASLTNSSWSAGDLGTGGANGTARIAPNASTMLHLQRSVSISSRTAFSWFYIGYYQVA
jgi:hypothetical protein